MPGARRRARRIPRRGGRRCRCVQLLSGQEPRRRRGCRRARDLRPEAWLLASAASASTARPRSTYTPVSAGPRASTRSRRSSWRTSSRCSTVERAASGRGSVLRVRRSRVSAISSSPRSPPGSTPVWHLYVVRTGTRDRLAEFLRDRGIGTGLHYPEPVHLTDACACLGHGAGSFPVAERLVTGVPVASDVPGYQRGAARVGSSSPFARTSMADVPRERRPLPPDRRRRVRRRTSMSAHSRISTAAALRREAASARSSRSSAASTIGERCKIQSHTFVCTGVEIGDEVFVGHGVVFINDKRPHATDRGGGPPDGRGLGAQAPASNAVPPSVREPCSRRSPDRGRRDRRRRGGRHAGRAARARRVAGIPGRLLMQAVRQ